MKRLKDSFKKLNPQTQFRNPVMFVTFLGAIFTTLGLTFCRSYSRFNVQITPMALVYRFICQFCQAIAESRGKAQAASLKKNTDRDLRKENRHGKGNSFLAAGLEERRYAFVCEVGDIILRGWRSH